ncbi:MAG: hypothetical protein KAH22_12110 [Thiotrichaceae bacterium]|nr:hypothetical protein [Thiotrichaceae bacterium]
MYKYVLLGCLFSSAVFAHSGDGARTTIHNSNKILSKLFLSETAYVQEQGEKRVITSPTLEVIDDGNRFSIPVMLEYGVTDSLQLGLGITPYRRLKNNAGTDSGIGNLKIGVKYAWKDLDEDGLNVAVGYTHESARSGLESERNLYVSFGKDVDLDPFIGNQYQGDAQAFLEIGTKYQNGDTGPYINTGVYLDRGEHVLSGEVNWSDDHVFLTPGITWKPSEEWEFGLGLPLGLSGETDVQLASNIIYNWE